MSKIWKKNSPIRMTLRSISWVQVSPSAFLHNNRLAETAKAWVSYTFDENRRAVGMLNPMRHKKWRHVPGARRDDTDDTYDHGLSRRRPLRVKTPTRYKLGWKVKVVIKNILKYMYILYYQHILPGYVHYTVPGKVYATALVTCHSHSFDVQKAKPEKKNYT